MTRPPRNSPLFPSTPLSRPRRANPFARLFVGDRDDLEPASVAIVRVLGPDARVVEPRRDRVRGGDLSVIVLKHVAHAAVEDADAARRHRGAVTARGDPLAARLDADDADAPVTEERMEEPDRV